MKPKKAGNKNAAKPAVSRPSVPVDTETWLTKKEAADTLNIGEKTIERYVAKGKIQQSWRKVEGRRPIAVYNPTDIEKLKPEHFRAEFVEIEPETKAVAKAAPPPLAARNGAEMFQFLAAAMGSAQTVALKEKLFLTVEEAAAYSGLPQAYLRRLIAEEKLAVIRSGKSFIRRKDLETL